MANCELKIYIDEKFIDKYIINNLYEWVEFEKDLSDLKDWVFDITGLSKQSNMERLRDALYENSD